MIARYHYCLEGTHPNGQNFRCDGLLLLPYLPETREDYTLLKKRLVHPDMAKIVENDPQWALVLIAFSRLSP